MKIKLVKPYKIGEIIKPVGREMEVSRQLGNQLITDGIAKEINIRKKTDKKNSETNLNTKK